LRSLVWPLLQSLAAWCAEALQQLIGLFDGERPGGEHLQDLQLRSFLIGHGSRSL
jgi:hypothetical protein